MTRSQALTKEPRQASLPTEVAYEPPYRLAGILGLAVFALYVITLAPSTAFWDTSEYIATGHILGIPHPPGNPVFVLLARAWDLLLTPLPISTAVKINMFSAANGAAAAAFWFLVAHRVLAFFSKEELFRRLGAVAAAVLSSTAFTVWNQSVVNEKVYTISLMTIGLLTWLIFRWRDNLGRGKDDNLLILIVFLLALSVGNHLMAFLAAPAVGIFVIWVHPKVLIRWRLYAFAALAWGLGLSAQLYLPIRAEQNPIISEGDPRCESLGDATLDILTFGKSDMCEPLAGSLRRVQYRKPPLNLNPIHYPRELPRDLGLVKWQFINYAQYFDWQWARSLDGATTYLSLFRAPFTMIFLLLGLLGAWRHYHADRTSWIYFATLFGTVWFGLIIYLNFRYGYSVEAPMPGTSDGSLVPRAWREVRERDYFFIVSFSQWGVWAGIGLAALWEIVARVVGGVKASVPRSLYVRTSPVLILALLPLMLNWKYASRAGDYAARDWAYNLLMSIEPYGLVFTNGDNDTFPLWYLQEVEGLRRDVTVIVYSYLATPWYARQLRDLSQPCEGADPLADLTLIACQRPFEPEKAIAIYEEGDYPAPKQPIIQMTDAELQSAPECYPVDNFGQCQLFSDTVVIPITDSVDGFIAGGDYLLRNDILVYRILQASTGDRPVYFASTTGTFEKFHLQPHMVRQGVAYKLSADRVEPSGSIVMLPGPARFSAGRVQPFWIDVDRSERLLYEEYEYRDLTDWTFWPDLSTNGIPLQYYQALVSLGSAYLALNDQTAAEDAFDRAVEFARVALGPVDFSPALPQVQRQPILGEPPVIELPLDSAVSPEGNQP